MTNADRIRNETAAWMEGGNRLRMREDLGQLPQMTVCHPWLDFWLVSKDTESST
jgi:hypothetical protein